MGTPDISVRSLVALTKEHDVIGVFCSEDKPVGRKQKVTAPATKQTALKLGIDVYQPKSLKSTETISLVQRLNPDLIVTIAYGRLLPKPILDIPKYGAINAHASLLPNYRGASPIQHAIMNREEKTGVTIMKLDEGLDTGDIIIQKEIPITPETDAVEIYEEVSQISAELLPKTVEMLTNGYVEYLKQDSLAVSYAPIITKDMGGFRFTDEANMIVGLIKGLCIWPGAYFTHNNKRIKVLKGSLLKEASDTFTPGMIISTKPLTVAAASGNIVLDEVMPESKSRMSGSSYIAGARLTKGDMLE